MKTKPLAPINPGPPCPACDADHAVHACATEDAAVILESDGKLMTAVKVRDRARAKAGGR